MTDYMHITAWIPPSQEEQKMEELSCAEELLKLVCDKAQIKHEDMLSRMGDSKVSNEWAELMSIIKVSEAYLTERERNNDANKS